MKIATILSWIAKQRPFRIINGPNDEPYLVRYFLFHIPVLNITAYLHHFVGSDPDRGLHDHPWGWAAAFVLAGGYCERRLVQADHDTGSLSIYTFWRRPGRVNFIRGDDWHRILLPNNSDAWTLFIHGQRRKGWGFLQTIEDPDTLGEYIGSYQPFVINRQWMNQHWWRKEKRK